MEEFLKSVLEPIIGCDLNTLGLGRYDVQVNLAGSGLKICIIGNISLIDDGKVVATWNEQDNWSSLVFQKLLNATVEAYSAPDGYHLEIAFTNGLRLRIHDDDDKVESVQIIFEENPNRLIVF
jgi:hypothetical protein